MSALAHASSPEVVGAPTAAKRSLGNNANNCGSAPEVRAGRFAALNWLWGNSDLHRVRDCCRFRVNDTVILEQGERAGRLTGLSRCASIWACPVCSARIQAERSVELAAAIENHHDRGGSVAMLTLTMRHNASQSLASLWDALGRAWHATTAQNRAVRRARAAAGVMGFMRTVEVTHGRHGWHVHIHALVFIEPGADLAELDGLDDAIATGWMRSLVNAGMPEPTRANGCEVRLLDLGSARGEVSRYLAKASYNRERSAAGSAAAEVTQTQTKAAGFGNRTPWQLLDDAIAGDRRSRRLWGEWEAASRGRRCHTWSRGLRDRLELDDELGDDELAQDDDDTSTFAPVPLLRFHPPAWDGWLTRHPKAHPKLLEAADTADDARALAVLLALPDRPPPDSIDQYDHTAGRWVPINLPNPPINPLNPDPASLDLPAPPPGHAEQTMRPHTTDQRNDVGGVWSHGADQATTQAGQANRAVPHTAQTYKPLNRPTYTQTPSQNPAQDPTQEPHQDPTQQPTQTTPPSDLAGATRTSTEAILTTHNQGTKGEGGQD